MVFDDSFISHLLLSLGPAVYLFSNICDFFQELTVSTSIVSAFNAEGRIMNFLIR